MIYYLSQEGEIVLFVHSLIIIPSVISIQMLKYIKVLLSPFSYSLFTSYITSLLI